MAADPARVWSLVSDLPRLAEWSPQVVRSFVRGRSPDPARHPAAQRQPPRPAGVAHPVQGRALRAAPGDRVPGQGQLTVWSFTLEPTATGTRVVQRREAPDGISAISGRLTRARPRRRAVLPGRAARGHAHHAGRDQGGGRGLTPRCRHRRTACGTRDRDVASSADLAPPAPLGRPSGRSRPSESAPVPGVAPGGVRRASGAGVATGCRRRGSGPLDVVCRQLRGAGSSSAARCAVEPSQCSGHHERERLVGQRRGVARDVEVAGVDRERARRVAGRVPGRS